MTAKYEEYHIPSYLHRPLQALVHRLVISDYQGLDMVQMSLTVRQLGGGRKR